jgi:hypothetical protein
MKGQVGHIEHIFTVVYLIEEFETLMEQKGKKK